MTVDKLGMTKLTKRVLSKYDYSGIDDLDCERIDVDLASSLRAFEPFDVVIEGLHDVTRSLHYARSISVSDAEFSKTVRLKIVRDLKALCSTLEDGISTGT